MLKKDKTKPFRAMNPDGPTTPTAEEMLMNCAVSKLKADRTPIPDNRFTLPPEYGVTGSGSSDAFNGHEYVDLGLPSGTKWAKMNVGASSEKDAGLYFAWGETEGYSDASTKAFSWSDYKWTEDEGDTMSKYNATDDKTVLDLEDDAAHVNMGGDWYMPNVAQCFELFKETKNGFVTSAGAFTEYVWDDTEGCSIPTETTATISGWNTAGYFFFKNSYTSVTDAITAEDYLFVPAAGYCGNGVFSMVGVSGIVWASALYSENVERAWGFGFASNGAGVDHSSDRCKGKAVRGVVGQMDETTPGGGGESKPPK